MKKIPYKRIFICSFLAVLLSSILYVLSLQPSNERNWAADQELLPYAIFNENTVEIKNIRNNMYLSRDTYVLDHYDKTFDLDEITSVDYIVEPLASVAVAHTFLSFGFKNGDHIAISIEIRKEDGEEFSPTLGTFNAYEIMYVILDEKDALTLRAIHRDNPVYVYPAKVPQDKMRSLFIDMLTRANKLKDEPEFYNTFTNTCATNIADHINNIAPKTVPWDLRLLLPKDSDEFAYELGLIDTELSFEETRSKYNVQEKVKLYAEDPLFSQKIRE
jgi:hypothetical protein